MVNPVEPETRITYNDEKTKMTAIHDSEIDSCFLTDYDPEWNLSGEEKAKISKSMPSKTIKSPIEFQRFKTKVGDVISSICRRRKLFWMTKPRVPPRPMIPHTKPRVPPRPLIPHTQHGPIVPQPLSHHIAAHPVPHHIAAHPVPHHIAAHPVPHHNVPHPMPHHNVPHHMPHHIVPHPLLHHMNHKSSPHKMPVPVPDRYIVPSKREIRKDVEIAPNSDVADEYIIPPKRKGFQH